MQDKKVGGDMVIKEHMPGSSFCAALADEIRAMRGRIEQLAELLAADPRFAADYLEQFQAFDFIVQHADESARLLDRVAQGHSISDAVGQVRLAVVQDRLRAALKD